MGSNVTRRILIADDHEIVRRGVRIVLQARPNLQVVAEASNGRQALEEALATQPDIAIIDYSLPDLNGHDLTRALVGALPRIEVLVYTIHDRDDLVLGVLRAGARGYVLKSDAGHHLLAAIDALSVRRAYLSGAVSGALLESFLKVSPTAEVVLTQRQREVVQLISEGKMNKEIADTLKISVKTVETHRAVTMHKLKLTRTADLVRYAVRNSIVQF